jgi:hypothetical protein
MGIVLVAFLKARAFSRRGRYEYVNFKTDQLISQGGKTVKLIFRGSSLVNYVLALNIAELTELSSECLAPRT